MSPKVIQQIKLLCIAFLLATATSATAQQHNATVTKAYSVQRQSVKQVADELQKALGERVTITADESNGRIVVIAPQGVHDQLAQVLPGAVPPAPAAPAASTTKTIRLQHVAPQTVGQTIQRLFNGRAPAQASADGNRLTITVPNGDGPPVQFAIDYANKQVTINATAPAVAAWARLIAAIDRPISNDDESTQLVSISGRRSQAIQRAMKLIELRNQGRPATAGQPQRRDIVQWEQGRPLPTRRPDVQIAQNQPAAQPPAPDPGADAAAQEGLLGPVQIEYLEGLDVIVLRGDKRDVERVAAIIDEIEKLAVVTEPSIEVLDLLHVDSQAMADLVTPLYDAVLSPRQGQVSITPLVQPNSLLLVGRAESVRLVGTLVKKLDQPTAPDAQFHVFRLKHLSATDAEETITEFYEERGGLGARVRVTSDFRSNSVIVQASPRDVAEVGKLIAQMDVEESSAVDAVRVFRLKFTLANELAPVLQQALRGDQVQLGAQGFPGAGGLGVGVGAGIGGTAAQQTTPRSSGLSFTTVDTQGKRQFRSGVLSGVIVTADTQSNTLIVRGPEKSMPLIEALIQQLDELPAEDAEIKVFTIVNGDALLLSDVLNGLFGNQITTGVGFQQPGAQATGLGESPLVPLRFSVDERTNSIVASGSIADLRVVEAILLRLDEDDVRQRQSVVFRLRYAPAIDVANAINEFLRSERQIQEVAPATLSPFQQIEREVVVVPEPVSNSLIVSATPRYFEEIYGIVRKLDERPPMVMIQVLIAEVDLENFAEMGVELGGQDPLLFDRGILTTITDSTTTTELDPGFPWNNLPLGNSGSTQSLATRNDPLTQGLSSFAIGRVNSELGFGGLVLSVSSDAVNALLRALEQDKRGEILARPQIMTLDNQGAFVQVGQRVPRITSSQITTTGTINNTVLENVGIVLGVTPRISPDGLVVMEVDAERSVLDDVDSGIPISISLTGEVIRSPIINIQTAQTVVSARHGQTVILGGLIDERESMTFRGVPYLSNVPILGDFFKYESYRSNRFELLIILTPYIIRGDEDVDCINQMEAERMSWCLSDVYRVHGYFDVNACQDPMIDGTWQKQCMEIYPDESPSSVDFPSQSTPDDYFEPSIFPERAKSPAGTETVPIPSPAEDPIAAPPIDSGAAAAQPTAHATMAAYQSTPAASIQQVQPALAVQRTSLVSPQTTAGVTRAAAIVPRDSAFEQPAAAPAVQHWAPGSIGRARAAAAKGGESVSTLQRTPPVR